MGITFLAIELNSKVCYGQATDMGRAVTVILNGFGVQNYRGVGSEWVFVSNFRKINFFIGTNNSGKSTLLSIISNYIPIFSSRIKQIPATDRHNLSEAEVGIALAIPVEAILEKIKRDATVSRRGYPEALLRRLLTGIADTDGLVWVARRLTGDPEHQLMLDVSEIKPILHRTDWLNLWSQLTLSSGGSLEAHWMPSVLNIITAFSLPSFPTGIFIPAMRRIGESSSILKIHNGDGLIAWLATIQNPELERRADHKLFLEINKLLQSVTDRLDARIEIPHNRTHILVHMDDRVLPLQSLGTGIEEIIMLASFCSMVENVVVCIEEPEIHLHPLLQKKLIDYLKNYTTNQYFIATHSAAFIDAPDAAVYHVTLEKKKTSARPAIGRHQKFQICMDLGHRASDILQANSVIWVEGPSDRIYLNYWLLEVDSELREGIHYSIMFYGGRLLSHLSASDDEVSEFIQLLNLNRNAAIIMDSDKSNVNDDINNTKKRIRDEFATVGVAWVTAGREIENYIPYVRLQEAVSQVYQASYIAGASGGGVFEKALDFERGASRGLHSVSEAPPQTPPEKILETSVDKVKVSREVARKGAPDLNILDLGERLREVVALIRQANGLSTR